MTIPPWATLILPSIFFYGVRCQVKVNQSLLESTREGETSTITCKYESSSFYSLQWYRQFPGEGPTHLLTITGTDSRKEPNFSADHNKKEKLSRLNIMGVQRGDAATYFCAVFDGRKMIFGNGTKLVVTPNLEDSGPSLYKLKPQKGENENINACLITDYSPGNISAGLGDTLEQVNSSLVITDDGPSYGTVLWGSTNGKFNCVADYKGQKFNDTKDDDGTCRAEFETDERLNFLSLTVLGLRIIFLKTVAINLLLTFRLWSC